MAQPFTVFVVDDDPTVLRSLSRTLTMGGHAVETYSSPFELLAKAPRNRPGCVLTDLRMPGMDGLQLQNELIRAGSSLPVILMSGHADVSTSVLAMKAGAVDFLAKPFTAEKLLETVRRALEKNKAFLANVAERAALRGRFDAMSQREQQVARLIARGRLQKDIATELAVPEAAVTAHRVRAMEQLGVKTVAELTVLLRRLDLP